jgi:hypothetical protein
MLSGNRSVLRTTLLETNGVPTGLTSVGVGTARASLTLTLVTNIAWSVYAE